MDVEQVRKSLISGLDPLIQRNIVPTVAFSIHNKRYGIGYKADDKEPEYIQKVVEHFNVIEELKYTPFHLTIRREECGEYGNFVHASVVRGKVDLPSNM